MSSYLFSKRYGYSPLNDFVIREQMTSEIENAICNSYDDFCSKVIYYGDFFSGLNQHIWRYFLNKRIASYSFYSHYNVFNNYILESNNKWFKKLDIIEFALAYLAAQDSLPKVELNKLIDSFNFEFNRLNYAYRIINYQVVEVTSEEEIASIQKAIEDNGDAIKQHLKKAIELCSKRPEGDYRNSIKESISAVEVICRRKTGEDTLGKALNHFEKQGIAIPAMFKSALERLYAYTNNEKTGIRHALMDDEGSYTPGADEALFMLVACSAFINYLNKK